MGVFATRRSSSSKSIGFYLWLGLSIGFATKELFISVGIDLVDGTPIYDIKPYLPARVEALPRARVRLGSPGQSIAVFISMGTTGPDGLQDWADFRQQDAEELRDLIQQTLAVGSPSYYLPMV